MNLLLDSCIVIDYLRGRPQAVSYLNALVEAPGISVITVTEIVAGIRNEKERTEINAWLGAVQILPLGLDESILAGDFVKTYGRSHGVDPLDAMIAATAKHNNLALATLNLKHFPMFPALARPY